MSAYKPPGAFLVCAFLLAAVSSGGFAADETEKTPARSTYRLRAFALGASGAPAASANNGSNSTLGQSAPVGPPAAAGSLRLYAGFWGHAGRGTPTGVTAPAVYQNRLFQNYPNPFNPTTTIGYSVAAPGPVEIRIFNVRGQAVRTLVAEHKQAGLYKEAWDGRNDAGLRVASGVYFYRLRVGTFSSVKKLVLLK